MDSEDSKKEADLDEESIEEDHSLSFSSNIYQAELKLFEGYKFGDGVDHQFKVTSSEYAAHQYADVRGTANPSLMDKLFWKHMIAVGGGAYGARKTFDDSTDPFEDAKPVWCFNRFGSTRTKLPDGRIVCIGGEHEDFYDPDFYIYNDVVVITPAQPGDPPPLLTPQCITIYGYPTTVFPPTDHHSSTYYVDSTTGSEYIFIIGGQGYSGAASHERTDVYRLDLSDFSIQRLQTSGACPKGGTCEHNAELLFIGEEQPTIKITTKEREVFRLRIHDLIWL
ncbi:hypothetical protein P7C71_g3665, partial [Lecanoromycetidae sp. Uapishka_2]